ncbi:MAG TPA: M48 family metallopeptidase [Rhodocyclaceae bacterium]
MNSLVTAALLLAIFVTVGLRLWLGSRQLRHVAAHRSAVPTEFAASIELTQHQKAADYTITKTRFNLANAVADAGLLLVLTLGGLLQICADLAARFFEPAGYAWGLALFALSGLIGFVVDLPFSLWRTFVIEVRFGFNKMTPALFVADLLKQALLTALVGGPLLLAVLWLMQRMGGLWWLWVWGVWLSFNLAVLLLYPTLIAPLFNKFSPMEEGPLKARIEALLTRCGFRSSGLFVMDGSKRSAHGNAYFTGMGSNKRIVFFDTLIEKLAPAEIEAVLAHELGHFRCHHVVKRLLLLSALSLGFLWLLAQLMQSPAFYAGLGVAGTGSGSTAMALLLFSLVLGVFTFPLSPLLSALSRRHEYQADAYAAQNADGGELVHALVKLYRDNAATLTPDPLHSAFYDSHPPASLRIARLQGVLP